MEQTPHIAILPTPGIGHLIPLVELAKRLALNHGFTVSFIVPTDGPLSIPQKQFLQSLPAGVTHILLPPVSLDDFSADLKAEIRMSLTLLRSLPAIREAVKSLVATTRLVALVVDLFSTDAFKVAEEFNVSPYIFFPAAALSLSLLLHLPKLDESVSCEYRDMPDPVQIPGCIPVHGRDLLDPVQDRKNDAYKWILHQAKNYRLAKGIMVNSFRCMEGGAIKALQEEEPGKPPVYPVGPLVQMDGGSSSDNGSDSECMRWLDEQPRGSVLFVSFGSGGTLSHEQLTELALGLEMSGQRFIWVVRSPDDGLANGAYFNSHSQIDPLSFLPKGFLESTKGLGLVVRSWAPQVKILSHGSTGGFMTHCGWNSTLESVVNGVPLIAWPLYAEQKTNAVLLNEDLRVALRPKTGEKGIIERAEIAKVVKGLMEGEEGKQLRSRMRDLKDGALKALSQDGDSIKCLAELAQKWKNKTSNE